MELSRNIHLARPRVSWKTCLLAGQYLFDLREWPYPAANVPDVFILLRLSPARVPEDISASPRRARYEADLITLELRRVGAGAGADAPIARCHCRTIRRHRETVLQTAP